MVKNIVWEVGWGSGDDWNDWIPAQLLKQYTFFKVIFQKLTRKIYNIFYQIENILLFFHDKIIEKG